MADLISKTAAIECAIDVVGVCAGGWNPNREEYIRKHFEKLPAVDAVPVVHGRWIYESEGMGDYSHCSDCGCRVHGGRISDLSARYKFCPNCGAKMKDE